MFENWNADTSIAIIGIIGCLIVLIYLVAICIAESRVVKHMRQLESESFRRHADQSIDLNHPIK